jgi:hypothetical protein
MACTSLRYWRSGTGYPATSGNSTLFMTPTTFKIESGGKAEAPLIPDQIPISGQAVSFPDTRSFDGALQAAVLLAWHLACTVQWRDRAGNGIDAAWTSSETT